MSMIGQIQLKAARPVYYRFMIKRRNSLNFFIDQNIPLKLFAISADMYAGTLDGIVLETR
jgi:hypothetical protein